MHPPVPAAVLDFYDALATHYHLIFEDWDASIARQANVLNHLLASHFPARPLTILDCACGIGTQAIGFATLGHHVTASDLSAAAVHRAMLEATRHGVHISFLVSDMTSLTEIKAGSFDLVVALDNALPHLSQPQLAQALAAIRSKLQPVGRFVASIRDYDALLESKPEIQPPAFYGSPEDRRIVHQVWDWTDEQRYTAHLYITTRSSASPTGWVAHHFVTEYRALLRAELSDLLHVVGFKTVQWSMPHQSGYYQPIVVASQPQPYTPAHARTATQQ